MNTVVDAFMMGLKAGAVLVGFASGLIAICLIISGIRQIIKKIRGSDEQS